MPTNKPAHLIDLRSDTVTRPTLAMREAMANAEVGDDVFGEDPTVNALEARMAQLAGKEAAVLFPSGTQSNLVALLVHCQRGDEYIVGQKYHTYLYEAGGAAVLGSIQPQPIAVQADGSLSLDEFESVIKADDPHFARTRLLALENTHAGKVMPVAFMDAAARLAHTRGLAVHLDGARLFNAAVASQVPLHELTESVDTVSLCCSKGLGAPMGTVLAGPAAFIREARRWRKMVGGGMRQAGIIAAAINHALDHHIDRLADDHRRAQQLALGLEAISAVAAVSVSTNMVYLDVGSASAGDALKEALKAEGILIAGGRHIRLVTHLDLGDADIDRLLDRIGALLPGLVR
ncbi:MAG TPA: low-specificity L-threonine aldolase [Pseudomonas xinjiangensis]|uniref:Low-specificity L-threonine aldolase n=2 Tax=root TaxID=1 RepID=A0A7V1BRZ9_9GAMM|nr:low-specificity L-threonine aldolase [Halopseudomonas xinjiangensis]HEC46988.1 low-specificity L-threonine aldolase [Halopseudomonas xinjiangensis]